MLKLFKKDILLAMHPVTPFFLLLSAMVLIPNYPYSVVFFYTGLSIFFTCLSGRENKDVFYSLTLPVQKKQIVQARVAFAVCLQAIQLILVLVFGAVSQRILPANAAGMEPNLAFFGWGLIIYAVFNAIFFGVYYRNVSRVGISFLASSAAVFLLVVMEIVATYAIPFVREVLDTKDPEHLGAKLGFLAVGLVIYLTSLFLTLRSAERNFEKQDI